MVLPNKSYKGPEKLAPDGSNFFYNDKMEKTIKCSPPHPDEMTPIKVHLKGRKPCNGYAWVLKIIRSQENGINHAVKNLVIVSKTFKLLVSLHNFETGISIRGDVIDLHQNQDNQDKEYIGSIKIPGNEIGTHQFYTWLNDLDFAPK